jgi:isopenicillin N synthase-like dioxygenase
VRIFAEALDLAPEFFKDKVNKHISQLRIVHYPPPQVAPLPGQLRAGAHSELGMMTLLYGTTISAARWARPHYG